jgi:HK97 family phage major capsid protein
MEWVSNLLGGVKHSPFTRIKTVFADITADEARAKGYTKGNRKVEEVFKLLKRSVSPTTIYKKQQFDRDDVLDITSFDVVAYIRKEMRVMLNEEIARAILIGDGRDPVTQATDKIDETKIIPIYTDDVLYSIQVTVPVAQNDDYEAKAKNLVKAVIRARKDYKGTGTPTFYCTADVLADLLLVEDGIGHRLYRTEAELATALMVSKIVTVEVMQNTTRQITTGTGADAVTTTRTLAGIIVNPADYVVGTDKGGEINTFDDFDIDFNRMKYLMETRMSGMLIKPNTAMVVEFEPAQG